MNFRVLGNVFHAAANSNRMLRKNVPFIHRILEEYALFLHKLFV